MNTLDPERLLAEHGDYLYRYALARLRDVHLAEDVVQETLLAALQGGGFAGKSSVRTWLTGILKHKIVDQMRRQSREVTLDTPADPTDETAAADDFFLENGHWSDPPQDWGEPTDVLRQSQFLAVLQECMDRLPRKLAHIFLLRDVQEMENEEICKALQITPTNAWVMLYRARMGLRKCLERNWLGDG